MYGFPKHSHQLKFLLPCLLTFTHTFVQGWGVAVLVGVPNKDAVFMTKPINLLNERTLKGTFFGNYKPRTDLPSVVDMYTRKVWIVFQSISYLRVVIWKIFLCYLWKLESEGNLIIFCRNWKWISSLPIEFLSLKSTRPSITCWMVRVYGASLAWKNRAEHGERLGAWRDLQLLEFSLCSSPSSVLCISSCWYGRCVGLGTFFLWE